MKHLLRILTVALAAAWLATPGVSGEGEGGENAGGTGVWILPGPCALGGGPALGASAVRQVPTLANDVTMTVSAQLGSVVATACEAGSGTVIPLSVSGRDVTFRGSTMRAFRDANVQVVEIVICDSSQQGYRIRFRIHPNGQSGVLTVY